VVFIFPDIFPDWIDGVLFHGSPPRQSAPGRQGGGGNLASQQTADAAGGLPPSHPEAVLCLFVEG